MTHARPVVHRVAAWVITSVIVATATLYVLNALEAEYPWINHDVAYHTYLGAEMARGERLYVDVKEDNPPGSPLLLGAIFVLGDGLGIPDFIAQHLFVFAVGIAGLGVLRFALADDRGSWVPPLTSLAYLLVLVRGVYANSLYPEAPELPYDFGQREHLFSLLFLPYVLARLRRRESPWWLLGFCGLLGWTATFKPFWPPMVVAVEAFVWWRLRGRDWRVPAALAAGMAAVVLALGLHSADSLSHFLTENVPMYLRGGLDHYQTSYAAFLRTGLHQRMVAGALVCALAAGFALRLDRKARPAVALLAALAGLAYFAVWHQGKFWSYHTMPFFALTVVPAAYFAATALAARAERTGARWAAGLLALGLSAAAVANLPATARMLKQYPPLGAFLCPAVESYERVMYFSMSVMVQYPPLVQRKEMVGPWTLFYDLPELLAWPDPVERERRLADYAASVREVVERERPELLVFAPPGQALPEGTTLFGILEDMNALPIEAYELASARSLGAADPRASAWLFLVRAETPPGGAR